jgi:hypothetical protein
MMWAGYICVRTEASGGHVIMNQQVPQQSAAGMESHRVKSTAFRRYANETVA